MPGGIFALDLATRLGWAAWAPGDAKPRLGSYRIPTAYDDDGAYGEAYVSWLNPMLAIEKPGAVVWEAPYVGTKTGQQAAVKLFGLSMLTAVIARQHGIPRRVKANNQKARKFFLGQMPKDRDDLKAATQNVCRMYGWNAANDDEADAAAVLDWACNHYRLDVPWRGGALFAGRAA